VAAHSEPSDFTDFQDLVASLCTNDLLNSVHFLRSHDRLLPIRRGRESVPMPLHCATGPPWSDRRKSAPA